MNLTKLKCLLEKNVQEWDSDLIKKKIQKDNKWELFVVALDRDPNNSFLDTKLPTVGYYQKFIESTQLSKEKDNKTELISSTTTTTTVFDAKLYLGIQNNIGYKCPKCNSYNTRYELKQDRSGDEGMSTYIFCLQENCMHQYKLKN